MRLAFEWRNSQHLKAMHSVLRESCQTRLSFRVNIVKCNIALMRQPANAMKRVYSASGSSVV